MRRGLLFFLLFVCFSFALFAAPPTYSDYTKHMMIGFVDSRVYFLPTIFYQVLPFDLDGSDVKYNSNKEIQVQGLAIGSYSLIANTSFHLYVSHTPLVLNGQIPTGKLGSVDYRLYLMIGASGVAFDSCLSDAAENPKFANNNIVIDSSFSTDGMIALNDKYIYVSMEDAFYEEEGIEDSTRMVVERLASGTYQSTIHFLLEEI